MSSKALDLLQTVGLLDKHDKVSDLSAYTPARLQQLFDYYAEHRLSEANDELTTWDRAENEIVSFTSAISARNAVLPLLPTTLVYSRVIVNDPAFDLAQVRQPAAAEAHYQYLGLPTEHVVEHRRAKNALAFFEELAPLMRAGIVVSLPLQWLHRPPEQMAINFSEDWYRSEVPDAVHDFVHSNVIVREIQPGPGGKGLRVLDHPPVRPTRGIAISFTADDPVRSNGIYLLWQMKMTEKLDESRYRMAQNIPWEKEPDKDQYDAWVYQSINLTIADRLKAIAKELALAERLGAIYLTESQFEAELCAKLGTAVEGATEVDAVNFLRANEPRVAISGAKQVLAIRESDQRLFERFHSTLLSASTALNGAKDFETASRRLLDTEILPQIREIESAGKKVLAGTAGGALLAGATVGLACMTGAVLPMAAVLGYGALLTTGAALPSMAEYISARSRPAFMWKKIIKD